MTDASDQHRHRCEVRTLIQAIAQPGQQPLTGKQQAHVSGLRTAGRQALSAQQGRRQAGGLEQALAPPPPALIVMSLSSCRKNPMDKGPIWNPHLGSGRPELL